MQQNYIRLAVFFLNINPFEQSTIGIGSKTILSRLFVITHICSFAYSSGQSLVKKITENLTENNLLVSGTLISVYKTYDCNMQMRISSASFNDVETKSEQFHDGEITGQGYRTAEFVKFTQRQKASAG